MNLWDKIKPYFAFTNGERKGIYFLIVLLLIAIGSKVLLPRLLLKGSSDPKITIHCIEAQETELSQKIKSIRKSGNRKSKKALRKDNILKLKPFDPNTATEIELKEVGFSRFVVNNILKYRNSGGLFRTSDELYKVYGIDTSYSELINTYCRLDTNRIRLLLDQRIAYRNKLKIEINAADSSELIKLPGIGSILSGRIVRYRDNLGGFIKEEQLQEVYGISLETYKMLKKKIRIDTSLIRYLNINFASEKDLIRHPYLNNYQSRAIIKYRKLIGEFMNSKQLIENYILTKEEYERIASYLIIK